MQTMYVKIGSRYRPATPAEVAEVSGHYALQTFNSERPAFEYAHSIAKYLCAVYAGRDYETFAVLFLTARHQLIECVELFRGTISGASVHPREVVKEVLWRGAGAIALAHNHPSGVADPSSADIHITNVLTKALAIIDVPVLDHLIIGGNGTWSSMKQQGLI